MELLTVLQETRALVDKGWCQQAVAKNRVNQVRNSHDKDATQFCLHGAVIRTTPAQSELRQSAIRALKDALAVKGQTTRIPQWNDTFGRTKEDVLELIDCAIDNVNNGPEVTHDSSSETPDEAT